MNTYVVSRGALTIALAALAIGAHAQTTLYTFNGAAAGEEFGISVSGAGDVNGDGFDDLIVGSLRDAPNGTDSGSARVFSGADGSLLYTFDGSSPSDFFGSSVSGAGDVNGDGFADLIVGAYLDDNNSKSDSGSAQVFSGFDGSLLYTFNGDFAGDQLGFSVSGAGDVNGDGFADLIVGAPGNDTKGAASGIARVFSGADGSILYTFEGDSAGDVFGVSVSGAGDVDGDGFADLIVGARQDDNNGPDSGSARVFSGFDGSLLYTRDGDADGDAFGWAVSGAGDVDGDGFSDFVVTAIGANINGNDSGIARVFSGFDGSVLYTFEGDSVFDHFGWSVSGAGDMDSDGFDDVIVGILREDNNSKNDSGSAQVFSGADGSLLFTFDGDAAGDFFGVSVSSAGDVDGDGLPDLIVGSWRADNNGLDSGSARVFVNDATLPGLLENLLVDVVVLNLNTGIENSLDAKLDAVLNALNDLNDNNDQAAVNALQAFINAVAAQSGKKIDAEDATALIGSAQAIIDVLNAL